MCTNIVLAVSKLAIIAVLCGIAPQYAFASEEQYGAGFWASPTIDTASKTPVALSQNNYGQGFTSSPTVSQTSVASAALSTENYGAGFLASPVVVNTFSYRTIPANYGFGFYTYGLSWSGYNVYNLGWWY